MRTFIYLSAVLLAVNLMMGAIAFVIMSGPPTPLRILAVADAIVIGGVSVGWILFRWGER